MEDLLYRLGLRRKTRREQMIDAVTERAHVLTNRMDSLVGESRREMPRVARTVRERARRAEHGLSEVLDEARDEAAERAAPFRKRGSEVAADAARRASARKAALIAALSGLAANWSELSQRLGGSLRERAPRRRAEEKAEKARKLKKKEKGYPGFWFWMLRLGLGFWFVDSLRNQDIREFIDYRAGEEMRQASAEHPVAWYKDMLDNILIPNASLVAIATIVMEALAALWYVTGRKRRLGALMGMTVSAHRMLLHYRDPETRGQHLVALLAQSLLLRTGG